MHDALVSLSVSKARTIVEFQNKTIQQQQQIIINVIQDFLAKLISSAWSSARKPFDFKKNRNLKLDSKNSREPDLNSFWTHE